MRKIGFLFLLTAGLMIGCSSNQTKLTVSKASWGTLKDGQQVALYTLTNANGMVVTVSEWGAAIQSIVVPDREGQFADVTLGYDSLKSYFRDPYYQGYTIGRYGNRIGKGQFSIDGTVYQLTQNDGENSLHGGALGFHRKLWKSEIVEVPDAVGVAMTLTSEDGEEGYPGTVNVKATFTLNNQNELKIAYEGTTDKPTILNMTHHTYYNLTGDYDQSILGHELQILANAITPVTPQLIPTGEFMDVAGTPFDFQELTAIGARIDDDNEQLKFGKGYDHNWVFSDADGSMKLQVRLYEPTSGRLLEMMTEEPGVQFYSGNFLNGAVVGKKDNAYQFRHGLCLEPQHFPDSPNHDNFPSTLLKPDETYQSATILRFSTK